MDKPLVQFLRVSGSYNYHIVEKGKREGLCGFGPKPDTRSRWMDKWAEGGRPYFPRICWKCAKKANISPSLSPDDATVTWIP